MFKAILDKDNVKEMDFSWIDNGFDKFHVHRNLIKRYFRQNKLDDAVMDYLYGVLLVRPSIFPNINNDCTIREYMHEMSLLLKMMNDPVDRVAFIFKNVNKNLKLPLLIIKRVLSNQKEMESLDTDLGESMGNASCLVYAQEDVVKINPKNLMRYCDFPEIDAKALFKNLKAIDGEVFIPKSNAPSKDANRLAIYMVDTPPSHSWYIESMINTENIEVKKGRVSLEQIEKIMDKHPLPITDLQIWRAITKKWYERNKNNAWATLSLQSQKRHLVNMIRHNSIGYTQAYSNVEPEMADALHDLAFDAIMRKIANTFPFLRTECQRQWEYREQHEEQWNSLTD